MEVTRLAGEVDRARVQIRNQARVIDGVVPLLWTLTSEGLTSDTERSIQILRRIEALAPIDMSMPSSLRTISAAAAVTNSIAPLVREFWKEPIRHEILRRLKGATPEEALRGINYEMQQHDVYLVASSVEYVSNRFEDEVVSMTVIIPPSIQADTLERSGAVRSVSQNPPFSVNLHIGL